MTLTVALFCISCLAPVRDVLVVDDSAGPGVDFTEIYEAVEAARSGDTILVKEGNYSAAAIDGKSLVITAVADAEVQLFGGLHVRNLTREQSVLLRGIELTPSGVAPGLQIDDCAGAVWLEDLGVSGAYLSSMTLPGLCTSSADDVTVVRCRLEGSRALGGGVQGGPGLHALHSSVYLFDSVLQGGPGLVAHSGSGLAGPGAHLEGGHLYASGTRFLGGGGGDGGFGGFFPCILGGDGGAGLSLGSNSPNARLLDSELLGGAPGQSAGSCGPGEPGPSQAIQSGSVCSDPFLSRSLVIEGPARSGQSLTMRVVGQPGDRLFLGLSTEHDPTYFGKGGRRLVGGVFTPSLTSGALHSIGVLDSTGRATYSVPAPAVRGSSTFYVQAVMFAATNFGEILFSSPGTAILLEPG